MGENILKSYRDEKINYDEFGKLRESRNAFGKKSI